MQIKYRERFVDNESFVISIDTQYRRSQGGDYSTLSLADTNFYTHIPPQFEDNPRIREIFGSFKDHLSEELIHHVNDFTQRVGWSSEVISAL